MQTHGTPEQLTVLYQALLAAQAEFPAIPKTKKAYNYKYAPLAEIHELIRPILIKHGLAVIHPIVSQFNGNNPAQGFGRPAVGTTIIHKNGGRIACDGLSIPDTLKIQEQGGYVTYGSRYGYCAMLGLTSEDEDEDLLAQTSPRGPKPARRDGVAQDGRATPIAPSSPKESGVDAGSIPDPSLPTKQERTGYVAKLNQYREHVSDETLQAFLLRQSGASEVRLIKKQQWLDIFILLDKALAGRSGKTVSEVLLPLMKAA